MFKRGLMVVGFILLLVTVGVQARSLMLSFYVMFPTLLLALFISMEDDYRVLFPWLTGLCVAFFLYELMCHRTIDIVLFGAGGGVFFGLVSIYRRRWQGVTARQISECRAGLQDLEGLRQKHHSRLESLHHLEKQVAGLLDLFEIARDFNDSLSFEAMAQILHVRVLPELPFRKMRMVLFEQKTEPSSIQKVYSIESSGVAETAALGDLEEREVLWLESVRGTRKLLQAEGALVFPLMIDGEARAGLIVHGAQGDDLAKFEVLASYMALQVKKVRLYETVKELSIRDGLTGVFVRRHFMERLDEELKRSIKHHLPLAVLMLDIDQFKRYNDAHGHLAGDATLKQVAALLRESLRKVDIVGRYGGEEFVVVTPETQNSAAAEVAERIRSNIARHIFKVYQEVTRVTVSVGVSVFPEDSPQVENRDHTELALEIIQNADKALYRAKEEGRNRVVFYREIK